MRRYIFYAVFLSCLVSPHRGVAQDTDSLIEQGLKQYNDLEYETSINSLSAALVMPGSSDEQKILIYQYLGLNYLVLGREAEAAGAFRGLLVIDENWSFDPVTTSPKVVEFFTKVKQKWIADGKPGREKLVQKKVVNIIHKIPGEGSPGQDLNLKIEIENPQKIPLKIIVAYKSAADEKFSETMATMKGYSDEEKTRVLYMVTIPGESVKDISVDYYINVEDTQGNLLGSKGDENVPLRIPVASEDKKKRKKRALLGGLLGGLGGAAVIGIILGVVIPIALKSEPANHTPQNAQVTVVICEDGQPGC
jgi:hypothetical protein